MATNNPLPNTPLICYAGETWLRDATFAALPTTLDQCDAWFTVRTTASVDTSTTDDDALIQKTIADGGITIAQNGEDNGDGTVTAILQVVMEPEDTAAWVSGNYAYDMKIKVPGYDEELFARGTLTVFGAATKST